MYYSPLRYPGGKGKLAGLIYSVFERNELVGGHYVEPYAGGASVALALLFNGYASRIIINDYDRSIYAFWHCVLNKTEELCQLISETEISPGEWYQQRGVQERKETAGLLELGFSTFFLNRTSRSGIILKAGMIGGKKQDGEYKIDARFNKEDLIDRIRQIAKYKRFISVYNQDAIVLINEISATLPAKTLIYFDPPYYVKAHKLYVNHYAHRDHVLVSRMINGIARHRWLVSYDNVQEIKKLYKNQKKFTYSLNYSAVNSTTGSEVIIYQQDLIIPKAARPKAA